MSGDAYRFNKKLNDEVLIPATTAHFNEAVHAVVAGVDRYHERTAAGRENTWISYTLTSDAPKPWDRFYLVDGQADKETGEVYVRRSIYLIDESKDLPVGYQLDRDLSGRVLLTSEGDAALSSGAEASLQNSVANGALFTYRNQQGDIWAEEVFDGSERLAFKAVFEEPGRQI